MRPTGHKPNKAPKLYPRVSLQLTHSWFEENKSGTYPRTEPPRPLRKGKETPVTSVQSSMNLDCGHKELFLKKAWFHCKNWNETRLSPRKKCRKALNGGGLSSKEGHSMPLRLTDVTMKFSNFCVARDTPPKCKRQSPVPRGHPSTTYKTEGWHSWVAFS